MKGILFSLLLFVGLAACCFAQAPGLTFDVQYELSPGIWNSAGGGSQSFLASSQGPSGGTHSTTQSVPYQFVCTYVTPNSTTPPTVTGSATVNLTVTADAQAQIIGAAGSASAAASCNSASATANKTSNGFVHHSQGPIALIPVVISASTLSWTYADGQWVGTAPVTTISVSVTATFTSSGGGSGVMDFGQASSTIAAGLPSLISANTMALG